MEDLEVEKRERIFVISSSIFQNEPYNMKIPPPEDKNL